MKKHILLVAFVILGFSVVNAQYTTYTSANQCSGTTNAPALPLSFTSGTDDSTIDITLTFGVTGDFGADFETFTIIGEDGTVFGPFNRQNSDNTAYGDCGATPMNFSITIPQALWNIWNNDGTVNMTFQANTDVNFCDDRACISSVEALACPNCPIITNTSPNQCSGTTNAPALPMTFNSSTNDALSDVTLDFGVTGDFGADFETFTIIGEDGTVFGPFNRQNSDNTAYGDCGATPMNFSITIPQALWNIWNNDGTVNMTFQANTDVNFCDDRACISSIEANYLGASCANDFDFVATTICQLGDEANFFVELQVNSLGSENTAFTVAIGGIQPNIIMTGVYTYGPFPSGTPLDLILMGVDEPLCMFVESGLDKDCSCDPVLVVPSADVAICNGESTNLSTTLNTEEYIVTTSTACTVSPTSTINNVNLGDDAVSAPITIPGGFEFFDITYNSFQISSNGFISFLANSPNGCCTGDALMDTGTPNAYISLMWEDLNPTLGGTIQHYASGTSYVIEFINIPHFGGGNTVTGQIILNADGSIQVNCISCGYDGGTHSNAIENETGTLGYSNFTNGQPSGAIINQCITYTPVEPCTFDSWITDLNDPAGSQVATTETTTVTPTSTTTYYAIADCGGVLCSDEVVVTVNSAVINLSSITTDLCFKGTETIDLSGDYISGSTNAGTWSTSGDGIFNDASNAHPTVTSYSTGVADRSAATVTLTLSANPGNICPTSENIIINIKDVSCTDTNKFDGDNN